jgi:HdeA/HdeB family
MVMRRTLARAGVLAIGLAGSLSAHGQVADLAQASCAQLMELRPNDRGQLIVWLHGYYAGAAQRAVLDRTKLEDAFAAVQQLCERNPTLLLIGSEARSLLLGEPPLPPAQAPSAAPPPGQDTTNRPRPARTGR